MRYITTKVEKELIVLAVEAIEKINAAFPEDEFGTPVLERTSAEVLRFFARKGFWPNTRAGNSAGMYPAICAKSNLFVVCVEILQWWAVHSGLDVTLKMSYATPFGDDRDSDYRVPWSCVTLGRRQESETAGPFATAMHAVHCLAQEHAEPLLSEDAKTGASDDEPDD